MRRAFLRVSLVRFRRDFQRLRTKKLKCNFCSKTGIKSNRGQKEGFKELKNLAKEVLRVGKGFGVGDILRRDFYRVLHLGFKFLKIRFKKSD